ncbi:double-stranded DNA-binding protein [Candidatus Bathyarchaeota archaeon]|nr:MAG: double-stranded DNA-binding protein [Candidatus Bathyarchaeota archaeon]
MSDIELEMLKLRKLRELERKLKTSTQKTETVKEDPFEVVGRMLVGRGKEVLEAARLQFPEATDIIINGLATLIKNGKIKEPISGELLHEIFRAFGYDIRLETKIVFKEHGKVKSLAEKLKEEL